MAYSPIVLDHFKSPRNVGEILDADGLGEVGNPVCGDMMSVYIKVEGDRIADIKFKTFGCGAAIAVSSMITELAKGKTLEEAMKIKNSDVAKALGGLPPNKLHCSNLGADALHSAIKNYLDRKSGKVVAKEEGEPHLPEKGEACYCPYCEKKVEEESPFCIFCGKEMPHEHDH
ncbi:MAG: Fe-S cluster assembly scaffold protein NifU [Deltaproteobacteria bacterium]|nr:Fe-S cluster assembly scaffold protein NifU [Deltaproteobacteria bacterium]MBI4794404.1 Fe-S cluster assembly scaffold protein NifU [Deltaproteobacteria bacterium]